MNQKGLTLAEVLITLTITVVVGALLLIIMVNSSGLFYQQSSKVEQGLGANEALAKIRATIKQSSSVAAVYPPTGSPLHTTSSTQLVLKVPSIDSSGNILANVSDYFVFFLDNKNLRFKIFVDSQSSRQAVDQILTGNADSLLFQYFDSSVPPQEVVPTSATKIKITLTLRQKSGADFEKSVATSEANLRND